MTEWKESDRDLGSAPPGPSISLDSFWDPEDAHPSAGDGKGPKQSVQVTSMLAQPIFRAMQVLMYRPDTPFRSPADVVRAAVWHYLRAVQRAIDEDHPYFRDALHREQLRADAEQLAEQHEKLSETLEHTHDQLTALLDSGQAGKAELRRRLDSIFEHEDQLNDYWRGTYRAAHENMAVWKAAREVLNARRDTPASVSDGDDERLRADLGHGSDGGVQHDPPGDVGSEARPDPLQASPTPHEHNGVECHSTNPYHCAYLDGEY